MIDIIRAPRSLVQPDDLPNDRDQVVGLQHPLLNRRLPLQALAHLVAAHFAQVVSPRVEEQRYDQLTRVVDRRRVAGPQPPVEVQQRLFLICRGRVPVQRRLNVAVILVRVERFEQRQHPLVRSQKLQHLLTLLFGRLLGLRFFHFPLERPQLLRARVLRQQVGLVDRPYKRRDRNLPLPVDLHRYDVLVRGLKLQPRSAVRNQFREAQRTAARRISLKRQVNSRRADQLRHDDALRTVDDERALLRHQRKVAHEDLLLLDLARLLHQKLDVDLQRRSQRSVSLAALLDRVLGVPEVVACAVEFLDAALTKSLDPGRRDRLAGWPELVLALLDLLQRHAADQVLVVHVQERLGIRCEAHLQAIAREVLDRRDISEQLGQTFALEHLIRTELNLNQVGNLDYIRYPRVRLLDFGDTESLLDNVSRDNHAQPLLKQ